LIMYCISFTNLLENSLRSNLKNESKKKNYISVIPFLLFYKILQSFFLEAPFLP
jgi:hypothetical protein